MNVEVLKNPIVLFRGSDIPKTWYEQMQEQSAPLPALMDAVEETREDAEQASDRAVTRLEELFAETKNPDLLNLKRDLFNRRLERLSNALGKNHPEATLKAIHDYLESEDHHQTAIDAFKNAYHSAAEANRGALQEHAAHEDLAKSIAFFNDTIYEKLAKYLQTDHDAHNKKLRKLDFFLLKLLVRGSMKTSPFSYLTKTGLAGEGEETFETTSFCEMNHSIILKIVHEFLRTDEEALRKIPVKVENFGVRDGKVYYVSQHSVNQSQKVFETSDKFVEYPLHPGLVGYLLEQKKQTLTFGDFAEQAGKISEYRGEEEALFAKLIQLKLLRQQVDIPNNRGILQSVRRLFDTYGIGEGVIGKLDELDAELKAFEQKGAFDRIAHWKRIGELIRQAHPQSGKELIYEDVIFGKTRQDLVSSIVGEDFMKVIGDFLLLFDVNVRVQYEIGHLFHKEYGDAPQKLTDSRLLNQVFFKNIHHFYPYYQNQRYRYREAAAEEIRILDDLRDEFLDEFSRLIEGNESGEVDAGTLIRTYSERVPPSIRRDIDISCSLFLQYASPDTVVLNDVYDGHEKFISRFKDFFGEAAENREYADYVNRVFRDRNYYEIDELFGFNGGIHVRKDLKTAKLEVGYRQFAEDGGHPVSDITVRYNPDSRKIEFLDSDGKICRIVYKSSLVPIFLPGILSVMLHLFQSGRMNFDITSVLKPYREAPRVTMGNVVLSRKKWQLETDELQELMSGAADPEELYARMNRYFEKNGLPKRFFLKYFRNEGDFVVEKPMFFDVSVPLLLKFFANELKDNAYIEELLPDPDIPLNEFLVEYSLEKERNTCRTSSSKA
ncbi:MULTISPECIES: lanthionine biosynthesis protein [Bhargavaea]|uniref:Lanthionine biosynthesis protein n=1 Tax=Bhargavaea changchunensis TaxID=2134037 RepID=A0ABW2NJY7_9BACL|nr:lanthionine biosynthesis protein [Bhargavaea sp. CC-171006]